MKRIFHKNETLFCILLIVAYVFINSFCIQNFGTTDYRTVLINTLFSIFLIWLIIQLDRVKYYGLTKVSNVRKYLYFIPLLLIISVDFWEGINIKHSALEIVFFILIMLNVGFIEEVIFRGFLFKIMEKDNLKLAIIVSAVTFGLGHIVNLLNGADFVPTLIQIAYAIALGYLFVIIFFKSKSLIPCIITHAAINALSIFNKETDTMFSLYFIPAFIIIIALGYAIYINKAVKTA